MEKRCINIHKNNIKKNIGIQRQWNEIFKTLKGKKKNLPPTEFYSQHKYPS